MIVRFERGESGRITVLFLLCATICVESWGCTALEQLRALVQAPKFEEAEGQPAEIRLLPPGRTTPLGGAGVRIWAKVTNPNSFGIRLGTLSGTLFLEGSRAANADFPLGLPLGAGEENVIPIDLSISFADLPGLANVIRRAANNEPLAYRLDGTIGVDAGRLGTPTFGPMTLLRGDVRRR
jgi:late embryogenesis abundant protein